MSELSVTPAPAAPAIRSVAIRLIALTPDGPRSYDGADQLQVGPPTLFAVEPLAAPAERYLYLVQLETLPATRCIVFLLLVDTTEASAARVPPAGVWQRAVVKGTMHLVASDLRLSRAQIAAAIGGHEPPPVKAQPPYT